MGRVKEVLIETDSHREAVVTLHGITIGDLRLTPNDLEQTLQLIKYLREVRPFETLEEITHTTFPQLASLDTAELEAPAAPVRRK